MNGLLPSYIPDYCLTPEKPNHHWLALIVNAFKKVMVYIFFVYFIFFKVMQRDAEGGVEGCIKLLAKLSLFDF